MFFSRQSLLFGATALVGLTAAKDDCEIGRELGIFGEGQWHGRPADQEGGVFYCDTKWKSGAVVTGLEAWSGKFHVKGLRLHYSDGSIGEMHGQAEGDWTPNPNSIDWNADEQITRIQKWGNWNDGKGADAVGKISVTVGNGQPFEVSSDVGSYGGEPVMKHSGIILGITGKQGMWLESLQWEMMSADVKKATIKELKFPQSLDEWNKRKEGIDGVQLADVWYKNPSTTSNVTYQFQNGDVKKWSRTLTHSTDHVFGFKVGLTVSGKMGVPLLAEGSVEASTEFSYQLTKGFSNQLQDGGDAPTTWTLQGEIDPGRAVHCTASSITGKFDSEYMAVIEIELGNGKKFDIEQPGHFNSVGWTKAVTQCSDHDIKDAPPQAIAGTPVGKRGVAFSA